MFVYQRGRSLSLCVISLKMFTVVVLNIQSLWCVRFIEVYNSIQFITFYLPVRWVKYLVDSEIHSNYRQSGDSH